MAVFAVLCMCTLRVRMVRVCTTTAHVCVHMCVRVCVLVVWWV